MEKKPRGEQEKRKRDDCTAKKKHKDARRKDGSLDNFSEKLGKVGLVLGRGFVQGATKGPSGKRNAKNHTQKKGKKERKVRKRFQKSGQRTTRSKTEYLVAR